jgi:hypothetical protein
VFAAGVAFSSWLTGSFVFGARRQLRTSLTYAGWYLAVYGVGLGVLQLAQRIDDLPTWLLGLAVISVTAPLNYLGGRVLFRPAAAVTPNPPAEVRP